MKRFTIVLMAMLAHGCATGPFSAKSDINKSSTQGGLKVSCNSYKTWRDCENAANRECPKGYEVISKDENIVMQQREMRIECK